VTARRTGRDAGARGGAREIPRMRAMGIYFGQVTKRKRKRSRATSVRCYDLRKSSLFSSSSFIESSRETRTDRSPSTLSRAAYDSSLFLYVLLYYYLCYLIERETLTNEDMSVSFSFRYDTYNASFSNKRMQLCKNRNVRVHGSILTEVQAINFICRNHYMQITNWPLR